MKILKTITCIFFLGFVQHAIAQDSAKTKTKKNNIQIQMDRFYFTKSTDKSAYNNGPAYANSIGLSYMRQLHPNWSIRFGFNKYFTLKQVVFGSTTEASLFDSKNVGKQYSREKWRFVDLELNYSRMWKQHRLSAGLGASFTQTDNSYIKSLTVIYYPNGQPHLAGASFEYKTEQYYGGLIGLHYDYLFWKNRIAAGADFKLRFYKDIPFSYDVYGIHVGYNF